MKATERVQLALQEHGLTFTVTEMSESTRTAEEAAQVAGCDVAQIAKTLVFKTIDSQQPVIVIASGANRVDATAMAQYVGEEIEKPDADFVREHTGFAIGGIPPVGHTQSIQTFIDQDLFQFDQVWAAGGTPKAIFPIAPAELERITKGTRVTF